MSGHDDCTFWGLTRMECVHYHSRLAGYYARRARWHARQVFCYAERAERIAKVGLVLVTLAILAAVILPAVLR